jgi:hypothetical protein
MLLWNEAMAVYSVGQPFMAATPLCLVDVVQRRYYI